MKFSTKRNIRILSLLSAFLSLFFAIIAQASSRDIPSSVTYIPSSPFYSSFLEKAEISYAYPTYEVTNVLLDSPISPSKSPSQSFFATDTWYEFSLETPLDGLYFQLFPLPDFSDVSSPKAIFTVEIESPDRTVRPFYSNSFSLFSAPSGIYRFRLIGSGFSTYEFILSQLDLNLTTPAQDYLVIEPDYILSENHWGQFDTFLSQGGHLLVISNSFFSKRYGAYFFPVNVENTSLNFYGVNLTSLYATNLSSLEMLESYSATPSECAYSRHFSTGMKGDLLQRFYCARTDGSPYTINFISKDLFQQVLNNTKLFQTLGPKLKELLSFPVPFNPAPPIKPLDFSPFNSIFTYFLALQNWVFLILILFIFPFFLILPSIHRRQLIQWGKDFILTLRRHPFISLLAFAIILVFTWSFFILNSFFLLSFKFVGQKYSYLLFLNGHLFLFFLLLLFLFPAQARRYFDTLSNRFFFWTDQLKPRACRRLFMFFLIMVTLFLYDFFIFYVKLELLFFLVFFVGIFVFFTLKRNGPVAFSKPEQIVFYIFLVFIFLSPFTSLPFSSDQRSYSFPASYGSDRDLSLIAEKAWSLPEGLLWVNDDFSLQIQSDTPFKAAELDVTLKGYQATLQTESDGRLTNFFISALNNFSFIRSFPPNINLYRGPGTEVFTRLTKPVDSWKEFIIKYLPKDSSVAVILTSSTFNPEDFPSKKLPLQAPTFLSDFSPSITFDPSFRFYTHLKNSFNLEMTFKPLSSSISSPLAPLLRFQLKDSTSRIIATQLFSPSAKVDSVFSFSQEDLEEDNYTFYFELASKESEEIVPLIPSGSSFSLERLRLNSKYLILNAPTMTLTGDEVLYFKNTGNDLRYTSLLSGYSFNTLGGKIVSLSNDVAFDDFATLPIAPLMFYEIIPPPYSGILESSKNQFFSFTRSSWFNHLNFSFTTSVYPFNNYAIVEDYPNKLSAQQDGWFSVFQSFGTDRPLKSMEIPFRFASDDSIAPSKNLSWILIKQIDLTLH